MIKRQDMWAGDIRAVIQVWRRLERVVTIAYTVMKMDTGHAHRGCLKEVVDAPNSGFGGIGHAWSAVAGISRGSTDKC